MASKVTVNNLVPAPSNITLFESIPQDQFFLGRLSPGNPRKLYFKGGGSGNSPWVALSIFEGGGVQTVWYPATSTVAYHDYEPVDVEITVKPRVK